MPNIFGISVGGLLSNQAALNTTAHNIANANTEGYSRQRVDLTPSNPQFIGGNYFGSGVEVSQVRRIFEQTHQLEIQSATANFMRLDTYLSQAGRVDGMLADSENGINNAIQNFFTAIQSVSNDPASIAARQVMLDQAGGLISRFDSIHSQLEAQTTQVNASIDSVAKEITALGQSIAEFNQQIAGSGGRPPPDLLDQRDLAVTRLSELVAVQTTTQADGSLNVFIGTGQSLVVGALATELVASLDPQDPRSMRLFLKTNTANIDITENISGGQIGGLRDVVAEIIEPAFNTLGRVAIAISDALNQQSQLGLDLNNDLGNLLFTDINDPTIANSRVTNSTNNTGTSSISLNIDDPSLLTDSNYTLFFQGGNYQLIDQTTNSTIATFAPPGSIPGSVAVPSIGVTINFNSGASSAGDSFEIQPARNFSRDISLGITSAEQIAAASPIRANLSQSNIGSGEIISTRVSDTTTAEFTGVPGNLNPPIRIEFDSPPGVAGEFSIYDMSSGSPVLITGGISGYQANQENDMLALAGAPFNAYGYEMTLAGDPQPGDSFDIEYNANGGGDNSNINILADLQTATTLDNGNSSFQQAFGRIISKVGVNTQSAQIKRNAAESILFQTKERRESLSGVNLDEEAANLLKFQQAYQASAQVISVARTLFQTMLDSVR
ncbi:MAG: flagellar hook-associated protein FlgK [Gammaproteobacteria bacterium]|nr:MAG: flagellar hook-associated protein FlgK [Gammaproteobacteria bacterium]